MASIPDPFTCVTHQLKACPFSNSFSASVSASCVVPYSLRSTLCVGALVKTCRLLSDIRFLGAEDVEVIILHFTHMF